MSLIPRLFGGRRNANVSDPFSLDVWDPFRDSSFPFSASWETSAFVNTRVDWKETPEAHVFKADVPGLKKEEVKVEIEDDRILQISGERNVEKEEKNDAWHRMERSSGKFMRRFRLPENVKMEEIKASMENGVLTVTIPKVEVKKPDVKSIEISGMGDLEKMDSERLKGDMNTTATRIRVKKNRIAELDHKIIEENVEEGLAGSMIQLPLAAVVVSAAFAAVVVVCYLSFRRRI